MPDFLTQTEDSRIEPRLRSMLDRDPWLEPYQSALRQRIAAALAMEQRLTGPEKSLADFALGHDYFGLHFTGREWVFREWAPRAESIHIIGQMTDWQSQKRFALERISDDGIWEISLPADALAHGDIYRLHLRWPGGEGDRIPSYARRVVQDHDTLIFNAQVWQPPAYKWTSPYPLRRPDPPLIYEAHPGMAQEEEKVGSFREFTDRIIPRVARSGYNTLQLMAVQEHPYYGSFGYHVSSFFAVSSRFGTPEDLKMLVDAAHEAGLLVIIDLVHSHAVNNEVEGISRFDGTPYQYFHDNPRGHHTAWDSRCFDYGKIPVLHFLLSNCRYWLEEYRLDGFRFDGITSMTYLDHGLEKAFTGYDDYFNDNVDEEALSYLTLANQLIHDINPSAVTIAEDVSGLPGLAVSGKEGGIGFDYRLAMGVPDFWIKLVKEYRDENWPMDQLWHELTNRRADEKTISYVESHDQALVGDQTLIFRMIGAAMYDHMDIEDNHPLVDRGVAIHKMSRLITLATAGHGYQNFMGNEFGHPDWIDFPREGNNWSCFYARRQWSLADNPDLKYHQLERFDRAMIELAREYRLFAEPWPYLWHRHDDDNILAFQRERLFFVFNFHPTRSFTDYRIPASPGGFRLILDSDHPDFGGHGRLQPDQTFLTRPDSGDETTGHYLSLYLPTRTALVLLAETAGQPV
ncbi:MAG: alpha amylase C-terminal domain-containing protein [Desulfosudaceae bacterium]